MACGYRKPRPAKKSETCRYETPLTNHGREPCIRAGRDRPWDMLLFLVAAAHAVAHLFHPRAELLLEIIALRQQLAAAQRTRPRPKLGVLNRLFWVLLSRLWSGWRAVLHIVQPATVIRRHRAGFRLFWRRKSGRPPGRPRIDGRMCAS